MRDNFHTFTLFPKDLLFHRTRYSGLHLNLSMHTSGQRDRTKRLVPFLQSLMGHSPGFSYLTRYYVVSAITGAHHLFTVGFKPKEQLRIPLFTSSHFDVTFKSKQAANSSNQYLQWYMQFMYEQVGLVPPTKTQKLSAFEVLRVASKYWYRCFGP